MEREKELSPRKFNLPADVGGEHIPSFGAKHRPLRSVSTNYSTAQELHEYVCSPFSRNKSSTNNTDYWHLLEPK
jgi:hypothetical protein